MKKMTAIATGFAAILLVGAMGCSPKPEETTTPPEGGAPGAMAPGTPASPGAAASPGAGASPAAAPPGPAGAPK
jgi:hypothetical protein